MKQSSAHRPLNFPASRPTDTQETLHTSERNNNDSHNVCTG